MEKERAKRSLVFVVAHRFQHAVGEVALPAQHMIKVHRAPGFVKPALVDPGCAVYVVLHPVARIGQVFQAGQFAHASVDLAGDGDRVDGAGVFQQQVAEAKASSNSAVVKRRPVLPGV